jgi:hypothetical protein
VILRNDFKEFNDIALDIDKEYAYVNVSIIREQENGEMYNSQGEIHIPNTSDRVVFAGGLTHEMGHSVIDPVTLYNYVNALSIVKRVCDIDDKTLASFGNIITDILTDYGISKNAKLSKYRREYLRKMFNEWYDPNNVFKRFLWAMYDRMHGLRLKMDRRDLAKHVKKAMEIVESDECREVKYLQIAKVLIELLDKNGGQGISDIPIDSPLRPSESDVESTVKKIVEDSDSVEETEVKLNILKTLAKGYEGKIDSLMRDRLTMFKSFYQSKANMVRSFIDYPKVYSRESSRVGLRKWAMSDGLKALRVDRTVMKYGVNIPLVTSRADRVMSRIRGFKDDRRPIDIIVSIDVSGSTHEPDGDLNHASDYEIIMLYALIDEAKRVNHRVGLTLWDDRIEYTSLPEVYDYRDVEKLKDVPLSGYWTGWNTCIENAINQAKRYKDKLFMVFTDGEVKHSELRKCDNAVFFLIKPRESDYNAFVEKYGEQRVIRIDRLENIPKVTLRWFRMNLAS